MGSHEWWDVVAMVSHVPSQHDGGASRIRLGDSTLSEGVIVTSYVSALRGGIYEKPPPLA